MAISIIITLLTLGCCHSAIKFEDIPGVYVCNHRYAPDTLYVFPDSSYVHKVHLKNKIITDIGCWKYDEGKMYFDEFVFYIPEYRSPIEMTGTWVSNIELGENNKVRFIMSFEQNEYYEKVYPKPTLFEIPKDTLK